MNVFEDCESAKHIAIGYQKVSLHDKEFDLVTSLYRNEDEKKSMEKTIIYLKSEQSYYVDH